jgi:hypothetical protein
LTADDSSRVSHDGRYRRPLDRGRTADFVALTDLLTCLVVGMTVVTRASGPSELKELPWAAVEVCLAVLALRMLIFLSLSGSMRLLLGEMVAAANGVSSWFVQSVSDTSESSEWQLTSRLRRSRVSSIERHSAIWYLMLSLGMLALMAIVASSGGLSDSPFRDILITTFILGQFRSPTKRAVLALFAFGVGGGILTQVLAGALLSHDPTAFGKSNFEGLAWVAPLLIAASLSTLVYLITFESEERRRLGTSGGDAAV